MIRIAYCSDTGTIIGGGEVSLLELLGNLDRKRFSAIFLAPDTGDLFMRVARLGVPAYRIRLPRLTNPLAWLSCIKAVYDLARLLRREQVDILHLNSCGGIVVLAGIACRIAGCLLIAHCRVLDAGMFSNLAQLLLADRVVVISRAVESTFRRLPFNKKVSMVYNGIAADVFQQPVDVARLRERLGIPVDVPLAGTVAAYYRYKGLEYFLASARYLLERMPRVRFAIFGLYRDPERSYLEHLKELAGRLGIADRLFFIDKRFDAAEIFPMLDVFVFPTLREAFGRVAAEAMACAKPVVAFATGGVPEVVKDGETGFLIAPRDYTGMAEKIGYCIADPAVARECGRRGKERVIREFSVTAHVTAIQDIYEQVYASRQKKRSRGHRNVQ